MYEKTLGSGTRGKPEEVPGRSLDSGFSSSGEHGRHAELSCWCGVSGPNNHRKSRGEEERENGQEGQGQERGQSKGYIQRAQHELESGDGVPVGRGEHMCMWHTCTCVTCMCTWVCICMCTAHTGLHVYVCVTCVHVFMAISICVYVCVCLFVWWEEVCAESMQFFQVQATGACQIPRESGMVPGG